MFTLRPQAHLSRTFLTTMLGTEWGSMAGHGGPPLLARPLTRMGPPPPSRTLIPGVNVRVPFRDRGRDPRFVLPSS